MIAYLMGTPKVADPKQRNVEVFKQTMDACREGRTPSSKHFDFSRSLQKMLDGSVMYDKQVRADDVPVRDEPTQIETIINDCLWVAQDMVNEGYNPAVLNMASGGHPGGGVENGARAQEETICRRSSLACSIYQFSEAYALKYGLPHKQGANYPMDINFGAIYSPSVTVLRGDVGCDYLWLDQPFDVGVISCAAINMKRFPEHFLMNGRFALSGENITKNRIRTIYRLGLLHGHDSVIIGAWGCGAFRNDPVQVAHYFRDILEEPEFKNKYRRVVAAVIDDHNSNGNANTFKQIFN